MKLYAKSNVFLIIWFISFFMTVFISQSLNIFTLVLAIITPFCIKDTKKMIQTVLLILIGTAIPGEVLNQMFSTKGITVLDVLIIFMFIRLLISMILNLNKNKLHLSLIDKLILVYSFLNIIALIQGIIVNGKYAIEFKNILIAIIFYASLRIANIKLYEKEISNIIFYAIGIYAFSILVIIIRKNPIEFNLLDYEGRLAINATLCIFTIPYGLYILLKEKISLFMRISFAIIMLLQLYMVVLNQGRTIIFLILLSIILIFVLCFKDTQHNELLNMTLNMFILSVSIFIALLLIRSMNQYSNPLFNRFLDLINQTGTYSNYTVRANTNSYYMSIILSRIFGAGWGSSMMFFNSTGSTVITQGSIDNFFITLGYKAGLIPLVTFILILILIYIRIVSVAIKKGKLFKLFLVTFPCLVIGTGVMTSQIHHTMTTSAAMWLIIYYFSDYGKIPTFQQSEKY